LATWDTRLAGESVKAWAAFTIYRDLGLDRTITLAWRKANKRKKGEAPGRWEFWSRTHHWVERAAAYQEHLDALRRQAREKRLVELAERRADFEFEVQALTEELVQILRGAIKQHDGLPITDVERIEDKEVIVEESGEIRVVNVKSRIKGIKTAGFARLSNEYRDTLKQAVVGVRGDSDQTKRIGTPKTILPEFMRKALEQAKPQKEAKTDGNDAQREP
jgi:hypothetical protein